MRIEDLNTAKRELRILFKSYFNLLCRDLFSNDKPKYSVFLKQIGLSEFELDSISVDNLINTLSLMRKYFIDKQLHKQEETLDDIKEFVQQNKEQKQINLNTLRTLLIQEVKIQKHKIDIVVFTFLKERIHDPRFRSEYYALTKAKSMLGDDKETNDTEITINIIRNESIVDLEAIKNNYETYSKDKIRKKEKKLEND